MQNFSVLVRKIEKVLTTARYILFQLVIHRMALISSQLESIISFASLVRFRSEVRLSISRFLIPFISLMAKLSAKLGGSIWNLVQSRDADDIV